MLTKKKQPSEKYIDLQVFKDRVGYELKYLKSYVSDISESIHEKGEILEQKMGADIDSQPENEEVLVDLFKKEISKLKSYFYHSSVVLIYTLLESTLSHLSAEIRNSTSSKLLLEDLKDNNLIRKSLRYIHLTCDIDLKREKKQYDRICEYQQLRNQIVHQNSRVKGNDEVTLKKNTIALKATFSGIEVNEESWDFHITESTLIEELVDVVGSFITTAICEIESKIFIVEP